MVISKKPVIKVLSAVTGVVGIAMLVPCFIALYYKDSLSVKAFLCCSLPLIAAGCCGLFVLPKADSEELRMRDGFFIVAISWLLMSLLGAIPFVINGDIPNYVDAFFETASGFSTTGSTVLNNIEELSRAGLFWRSFTHWLGGMGVLVLTIALLPMLGIGGQKVMRAETTGPSMDKSDFTFAKSARILYYVYIGITVLCYGALRLCGLNKFDSVIHAFGTMGTGGFSNYQDSIAALNNPAAEIVIAVFMLLCGVNFGLYALLLSGKVRKVFADTELKVYLLIVGIATIFIAAMLFINNIYSSLGESLRYSFFQVVSIVTTTGFATADYTAWPLPCQFIIFALLFVGGCASSTAGGMKVIRIILIFKLTARSIKRMLHPNALAPIRIGKKQIESSIVSGASAYILLYAFTAIISTVFISLFGSNFITALTASITALSNVGPGFGMVGPAFTFATFSAPVKIWLALLMIAGRLELYTMFVLLTKTFWDKTK